MKRKKDISFLGRVVLCFRNISHRLARLRLIQRFDERQRDIAGYQGEGSPRDAKLSYYYNIVKIGCVSAFCVILAVAVIFCGGIFTYENVYYMFKDITYITDYSESSPHMLSYSKPVSNQDFAAFKGGLAAISDSEIKFFTSTGRATLTLGGEYTDPKVVTGDSYALIYDSGKESFSIYNSFICLYSEQLDHAISSADMSDDGRFAVVTRGKSYSTAVRVYDSDFSLLTEYSKNDYIISAKLSPDGRFMAVLSFDAQSGTAKSTLSVLKIGDGELYSSVSTEGGIPYSTEILSADRVALFFSDRVTVYSMKGRMISEYYYPSELSAFSANEEGYALLFDERTVSGASMLAIFDRNGKAYTPKRIEGDVRDVEMSDGYVYLLCSDRVVRVDAVSGAENSVPVDFDGADLVVTDSGKVLLCTSASAYYISFN